MPTKCILLAVADPQLLIDTTQALGAGWEVTSVASEEDALAHFEKSSFDALLVDFNLSSPDASELLNQVAQKHSQTIRFLLAHEADLALVAAKVLESPHILPKPIEPAALRSRIENEVNGPDSTQSGSESAESPAEPTAVPAIYSEVLKALETPGITNEAVGDIIARDEALTAELLRLTNSSYLGLPRNITSAGKAVELLGLETVKAVVTALQFLAEHKGIRTGYLSLEQVWEHSVNVAQIARDLVLFETKDRALAAQALTAGLLHDLGKVVLAKNFEDLYGRVQSLGRKQPVAAWDIEKEMFGANHGEIGACLIGMWNLPLPIVDAAALHHEPPAAEDQQLTPLAAVHVANVLEHELRPEGDDMMVAPVINTPFLNQLGLLHRLPVWRAAFANHRSGNGAPEDHATEAEQSTPLSPPRPRTVNPLRRSSARRGVAARNPVIGEGASPVPPAWRKGLVWAGAAGILFLLALLFRTQPESVPTDPVYARTPGNQEQPSVFSSTPVPETAPSPAAQSGPTVAVSDESHTPVGQVNADPEPDPLDFMPAEASAGPSQAGPKPASGSPPAVAHSTTPTNVVTVTVPPVGAVPASGLTQEKKPLSEFHLNGIIYTSTRPSAIVNGQTVQVGHEVNGATVVGITQTTVTLQINGQRKTLELH